MRCSRTASLEISLHGPTPSALKMYPHIYRYTNKYTTYIIARLGHRGDLLIKLGEEAPSTGAQQALGRADGGGSGGRGSSKGNKGEDGVDTHG